MTETEIYKTALLNLMEFFDARVRASVPGWEEYNNKATAIRGIINSYNPKYVNAFDDQAREEILERLK